MKTAPAITSREQYLSIRLLTTEQLCKEFSVTRPTLLSWRRQGMPYVALGSRMVRYSLPDVCEWLEERKNGFSAA